MQEEYAFVCASLRRRGVPAGDIDDAAQRVFCVLAAKLPLVLDGRERSFLYGTAVRVASHARRRHAGSALFESLDVMVEAPAFGLLPDDLTELHETLSALEIVVGAMPRSLRDVLRQVDIEQRTMPEVAALSGVPVGTIASRLRRAREFVRINISCHTGSTRLN